MRATWDALAGEPTAVYVGDPARATQELDDLFGRLGGDPPQGLCVEVGCGPGRMTVELAGRFDRVVAVDVSPAMVERARAAVAASGRANVELRAISGERLDGVGSGIAATLVCYLVLQHLPRRDVVIGLLVEFARVLRAGGEAFVQVPVLEPGLLPRAWRLARSVALPLAARASRGPEAGAAFRGFRLTERELLDGIASAGLEVRARGEGPDAPYRYSRDLFLRLRRP